MFINPEYNHGFHHAVLFKYSGMSKIEGVMVFKTTSDPVYMLPLYVMHICRWIMPWAAASGRSGSKVFLGVGIVGQKYHYSQ